MQLIWPSCMMTSSNGNIFRITDPLCGEFAGHQLIPAQRTLRRRFHVFLDLFLNKRLSNQSWGWSSETQSRPLWRHRNEFIVSSIVFHNRETWPAAFCVIPKPPRPFQYKNAMGNTTSRNKTLRFSNHLKEPLDCMKLYVLSYYYIECIHLFWFGLISYSTKLIQGTANVWSTATRPMVFYFMSRNSLTFGHMIFAIEYQIQPSILYCQISSLLVKISCCNIGANSWTSQSAFSNPSA